MPNPNKLEVGTSITLRGLTVRGKNRVQRGGHSYMVKRREFDERSQEWRVLVISVKKGHAESFWINESNDPHMQRLNGSEIGNSN